MGDRLLQRLDADLGGQAVGEPPRQNAPSGTAPLFQIQKDQARLYKGDCSSWTGGTLINGGAGASLTVATPGTYIISIKYSTKSIVGTSAPTSDPVTYTFIATPPGTSSSGTVLLKKQ